MSCPQSVARNHPVSALRIAAGALVPAATGPDASKKITTPKTT